MSNGGVDGRPSRVAVYIPTTAKPVSIVSLIEEPPDVGRSTICINKTTDQAGIAAAYNDFVKRPTGVIHRLFGKEPAPVYRLDVSGPIEAGSSWQLAVLIAHALHQAGDRLDVEVSDKSSLFWATGAVNPIDYSVVGVTHVAEKLRNSLPLFESGLKSGRQIQIFVPRDNIADLEPDIVNWLKERQIEHMAVSSVDEVLSSLRLPAIPRAASSPRLAQSTIVAAPPPNKTLSRNGLIAISGCAVVFLSIAFGLHFGVGQKPSAAEKSVTESQRAITPVSCREEKSLRSQGTSQPTSLSFRNMSGATKRIYWITHEGLRKQYAVLDDQRGFSVQTYVTHPWVITASSDECEAIFLPEPSDQTITILSGNRYSSR